MARQRKKVKYLAEVVSYGIEEEELSDLRKKDFPKGKQFPVLSITWDVPIGFWVIDPDKPEKHKIYCLLGDCAHLKGGSWKLIPFEVEKENE